MTKPLRNILFIMSDQLRFDYLGCTPMLFDLAADPNEFNDLGADEAFAGEKQRLHAILSAWGLRQSQRTTLSDVQIAAGGGKSRQCGILIGVYDETDAPAELWTRPGEAKS